MYLVIDKWISDQTLVRVRIILHLTSSTSSVHSLRSSLTKLSWMCYLKEYLDRIDDKNRWDVWNHTHTSSENEDHASSIWMIFCVWQDSSVIFWTSEIDRYTMTGDNIRSVLMIVSDLYKKKKLKLWCSSIRIGLCRARLLIYLNICFCMIKRNTIRMNSVEPCVEQNLNWRSMVWNRRFLISRDRYQKTDLQSSQRKFQRETSYVHYRRIRIVLRNNIQKWWIDGESYSDD